MSIQERPPALDADRVRAFVVAGTATWKPCARRWRTSRGCVNACWDWGGGDWETALGGASHMGEREIALFLLERGARLDVFAAAMLGNVGVVRALLDARPELRDARAARDPSRRAR